MLFLLALLGLDSKKPTVIVTLEKDKEGAVTLKMTPSFDERELSEHTRDLNEAAALLPPGTTIEVTRTHLLDENKADRILVTLNGKPSRNNNVVIVDLVDEMKDLAAQVLEQVIMTGHAMRVHDEVAVSREFVALFTQILQNSLTRENAAPLPTRARAVCPNCGSGEGDNPVMTLLGAMGIEVLGLPQRRRTNILDVNGLVPHGHPLFDAINGAWERWVNERFEQFMSEAAADLRAQSLRLNDRLTARFGLPALASTGGPPQITASDSPTA